MPHESPNLTLPDNTFRDNEWWRSAAIYQVYIRSFADGNGDGVGDIAGIRNRLSYLAELGVDAIWVNPWYPSPMEDAGYDISDYRSIEPSFGTMEQAEAMIAEAHDLGMRVILDLVPNHVSEAHPWFQEALLAQPGSAERDRFHFRPGKGAAGDEAPNDWVSSFGGPAWTRVKDSDGNPGEWYLHLFTPGQPDVNWRNADIRGDFETTLRFWFDRGVDGFRIDVAQSLCKDADLPDLNGLTYPTPVPADGSEPVEHPHFDRDEVHDIYRSWRAVADSYDPPRVFVAEAWVGNPARLTRYLRPDELHSAFNFNFLLAPWNGATLRSVIDTTITSHAAVNASPTWVLSNHDGVRHLSKYARPQTDSRTWFLSQIRDIPGDFELGERRARAAAMLMLALPGGVYIYQGEELGLAEVEDIPDDQLQDPIWERTGHRERGRDGCRVPLPWSGDTAPYGFSPPNANQAPWLPQPQGWGERTVEFQTGKADSTLELYRSALSLRRSLSALATEPLTTATLTWMNDDNDQVLDFRRGSALRCVVNTSSEPIALPDGDVLLASRPLPGNGTIPADTAVWQGVPCATTPDPTRAP